MSRVLITGAAGFIGSHLCEYYILKGFQVIGVDNFLTGVEDNLTFRGNPYFKFKQLDINNAIHIKEKIDIILDFASPASPYDYLKHPLETIKSNSIGTYNIIKLALEKNARIVFASTSEVYGDPLIHPQSEEYWGNVNPIGPRSVYDESKRFSETMLMAFHREHDLDVRIIRIFNTYGPRMKLNDGRVVPNFIVRALKGEDLIVYGDGKQTRSFCYVDDLVSGVYKIAQNEHLHGEVLNLGNPEEYAIIDFAKLIIEKIGSLSKIKYESLPEDDPRQRCPDLTKTQSLIEWNPKVSLDIGLDKTIRFFQTKI